MIKNYLLIAIRNMSRNKAFSLINLLGLSLGMALTVVVANFVIQENSFDKFHENGDRIYRVNKNSYEPYFESHSNTSVMPPILAREIETNIPRVEKVLKFIESHNRTLTYREEIFSELRLAYFDSLLFDFLSFELTLGNPDNALSDQGAVVLSFEMASRIFGDKNPLGQIVHGKEGKPLKVTGVLAKPEGRTHFEFDYIIPYHSYFSNLTADYISWAANNTSIYVQVVEGADIEEIENSINKILKDRVSDDQFESSGKPTFYLQPIADVYLGSSDIDVYSVVPKGDPEKVNMFAIIAIIVLILACANFINLSTAMHTKRAREIGLRKVIGASKKQLILQFLLESILMAVLAGVLSVLFADLMVGTFDEIVNRDYAPGFFGRRTVGVLITIVLITGVLAGLYPAFYLSSFQPDRILRAKGKGRKYTFRNVLFVFQFSLATVFILITLFINKQLVFIEDFDQGFNHDELYYISFSNQSVSERQVVKNELAKSSLFSELSFVDNLPFLGGGSASIIDLENGEESDIIHLYCASDNAIETMGMSIVAGRDFIEGEPQSSFLINETLAKMLGGTDAIGKSIFFMDVEGQVVGIVKDFHRTSLHNKVQPIVWRPENLLEDLERGTFLIAKVKDQQFREAAEIVELAVADYKELDGYLRHGVYGAKSGRFYVEERKLSKTFTYTSTFAIIISCMGLLGLMSFTISSRAKEVGIRKVLGASIKTIVSLLCTSFAKLILLSLLLSIPLAIIYVHEWLSSFVYHTEIGLLDFVWGAMAIISLSVLTILYQMIKASKTNPIDSLKYE